MRGVNALSATLLPPPTASGDFPGGVNFCDTALGQWMLGNPGEYCSPVSQGGTFVPIQSQADIRAMVAAEMAGTQLTPERQAAAQAAADAALAADKNAHPADYALQDCAAAHPTWASLGLCSLSGTGATVPLLIAGALVVLFLVVKR